MKILCVIDNLGSGGAQRQLVSLACGLKARGHEIEFFVYYPQDHFGPLLAESHIPVRRKSKPSRFSFAPILHLRRLIKNERFDVIISFLDTPNFYAEIANLWNGGTKLVVSSRSAYPQGGLALRDRCFQWFHRFANAITTNSHHQREKMVGEFSWMQEKIRTIYNGVDLNEFKFSPDNGGLEKNLSLVSIASVTFNKNSLNLAKAIAICRDRYGIDVKVDWIGVQEIVGEGTRPTDETNAFLSTSSVAKNWRWLGVRSDISERIVLYDALVHASFYEGLANVICEALACGRPVLASRVCDNAYLVQEKLTGFLFDPELPSDIANAIRRLAKTSGKNRSEMSNSARAYAEKYLSLERFVDEYEDLFNFLSPDISSKKCFES